MINEIIDEIESLAIIPNVDEHFNELWVVVNRENGRFIERLSKRLYSTTVDDEEVFLLEDQIFLDSCVSYDVSPTTSFSGLSHLEGETVSILADGLVLDDEVVSGGSVNLSTTYSVVHIGLGYNQDIETVSVDEE